MINDGATFDAMADLTDEMQRCRQMLALICIHLEIDPVEAARLPGELPELPALRLSPPASNVAPAAGLCGQRTRMLNPWLTRGRGER